MPPGKGDERPHMYMERNQICDHYIMQRLWKGSLHHVRWDLNKQTKDLASA